MTARVAVETSGPVASVAVAREGRVSGRRFLVERGRHARGLVPALEELMTGAGLARRALTAVVVGAGPGSFTGVRVAAAAAKGLAHALKIPLYPISSLAGAALTETVLEPSDWPEGSAVEAGKGGAGTVRGARAVAFDARGERFFAAAYRLGDGPLEVLQPPAFRRLDDLLQDPALENVPFCGDGALRHADAFREAGRVVLPAPAGHPSADGLLRVLQLDPHVTPVADPGGWVPEYLRATGAERSRRR